MSRVLVFGGAGYIGSHTCKNLSENGFTPVTFDNLSEGHKDHVKWGDLIVGDIRNQDELDKAVAKVRPSAAVHFAACAYVGESVRNPSQYYENNVRGSLNIIQTMHRAGNIPLIFSSSCATYGDPAADRISETTPQNPINPYGRTKLMTEHMLQDFSAAYGLRSVALRYFNAAGADPDGEIGESHREETHLIPRAILSGLGEIDDFYVFGTDYSTPDGTAVRDYIHVTDLARAHVAACKYLLDGGQTDQFNLGVGEGYSVKQIIETVKVHLDKPVPHHLRARRPGDPASLVADASKAQRVLGFEPLHSSLNEIVETATAWHRKQATHNPAEAELQSR
ncbi:UDP-arabinose 4-epimerase [Shimia isoporae]|uniref:UDP-glucose 4-epimerase n=1 Tax=Shimia isoporae TaxID=647720 RepID=A0A4R1NMS5_9RHOB|nr:UDP-glucose 4-epimerase GalE [Shimia isoporae]TCL09051.1 UDP-arabinose 4-epimerase [Shimia isoporae]